MSDIRGKFLKRKSWRCSKIYAVLLSQILIQWYAKGIDSLTI